MKIRSIFNSIDGEVNAYHQGCFSTFIRVAGCSFAGNDKIRCAYCDTSYAWSEDSGKDMTVDEIVKQVEEIGCRKITITGGEPCHNEKELIKLLKVVYKPYIVTLETNGSYDVSPFKGYVDSVIMDYKLKSSGIPSSYMKLSHFSILDDRDFIKFVISDVDDYNEACIVMKELEKTDCNAQFAFSSAFGKLEPKLLVEWLQRDKFFDTIINIQLHKIIWPNIRPDDEH
jgi:7-carboxy-7-deazaguanine synthase